MFYINLLILLTLHQYVNGDVKTYYGIQSISYAKYKPWNASMTGTLKFKFKTRKANGVLLYMDDHKRPNGYGNFLKLRLVDNSLRLRIQVSHVIDIKKFQVETLNRIEQLGYNLNDDRFHYVTIQRSGPNTYLTLDGRMTSIHFPNVKMLSINSSVYVGGVPEVTRMFMDKDVIYDTRFIGCVSKLRYDNGKIVSKHALPLASMEAERGTGKGCRDLCRIEPTKMCYNGAKCLNKYVETGCDCRGTGFTGENCLIKSESLQFSGFDYLMWKPEFEMNNHASEILLRFKTAQSSGILLFAQGKELKNGYLLVELYERSLITFFKTQGTEEEVITLGDNAINQTSWRFLRIVRNGKSISLKLDDGDSVRRYLKQVHVDEKILPPGFLEITQVYIGGVSVPNSNIISKSKTHFTGCMQDIVINQYDVISLTTDWSVKNIERFGNVKKGCDVSLFDGDLDDSFTKLPSLITNWNDRNLGANGDTKQERKNEENSLKRKKKTKAGINTTWIIVGCCCSVLFIMVLAFVSFHCIQRNREARKKRYREHFLRQAVLRQGDQEELPLNQKCIRSEIDKPDLKTFSPVRRAFYEVDTLQRPQETIHKSYEAMVRNRDEIRNDDLQLHHHTLQRCRTPKERHYESTHHSIEVVHSRNNSTSSHLKEHSSDESIRTPQTIHRCRKL